jgi:hypothetical protein
MMRIDPDKLLVGDIFHARSYGFWGRAIRHVLGSWGNHDAPVLEYNGRLVIGDSHPGGSVLTPLEDYQQRLDNGEIELRVYRVQHVTFAERHWASAWWIDNVLGSHYDYLAYGRLILKRIFGDVWKRAAGWRWAWWCTEGTRDMWIKPKQITREIDPWKKSNPTPLTTEHRVIDGRLIAVDFESS